MVTAVVTVVDHVVVTVRRICYLQEAVYFLSYIYDFFPDEYPGNSRQIAPTFGYKEYRISKIQLRTFGQCAMVHDVQVMAPLVFFFPRP